MFDASEAGADGDLVLASTVRPDRNERVIELPRQRDAEPGRATVRRIGMRRSPPPRTSSVPGAALDTHGVTAVRLSCSTKSARPASADGAPTVPAVTSAARSSLRSPSNVTRPNAF
jgi:hypothetical protein